MSMQLSYVCHDARGVTVRLDDKDGNALGALDLHRICREYLAFAQSTNDGDQSFLARSGHG